jgi:putative endonuclease
MPSSELSETFCYVYVLRSLKTGGHYTGFTHDLRKRFAEHNSGLSRYTKPYVPWEILYYEAHRNEKDARHREKYLKTTAGRNALHKMLHEQLTELGDLDRQKVYY